MKFGLQLFGVSVRHYATVARAAELAGFESVWVPEHLVFPEPLPPMYPYSADGLPQVQASTPLFDPWVALAAVAATTSTIRLATNIFILPLRHPLEVARSVVTLDRISGGRVTMGVGVGWLRDEFDAVGFDFSTRGARTDAMIPLLRRLWSEEVIEYHDEHFDFGPVRFEPKPVHRHVPIEVGGSSAAALRRAGRLGDGWIEIGADDFDAVSARIETITTHRRSAEREQLPFEVTIGGQFVEDLTRLDRYIEAGVTRIIVSAPPGADGAITPESVTAFCDRFGGEVIARWSAAGG